MTGTAVIALGANTGDRLANLRRAVELLRERFPVEATSGVYATPPAFYENQPDFYNAAAAIRTDVPPAELLSFCKDIERLLGRRPSFRNAPRPADLDIIFYENNNCKSEILTIPHVGWSERDFVIAPLLDLFDAGVFSGAHFAEIAAFLRGRKSAYEKICTL